jgi:hypothetical protein
MGHFIEFAKKYITWNIPALSDSYCLDSLTYSANPLPVQMNI